MKTMPPTSLVLLVVLSLLLPALLSSSPTVNTGDNSGRPATDQRGVAPQDPANDVGAYDLTGTLMASEGITLTVWEEHLTGLPQEQITWAANRLATDISPAVVFSFTVPGNRARGLVWGDGSLWLADEDNNVYRLDSNGQVQATFPITFTPDGLAWDGSNLWGGDGWGGGARKLDATGKVITQLAGTGYWPLSGLAWAGNYLFVGDYNSSYIHKHDQSGNHLLSWSTLSAIFGHPTGIAYDGTGLWIGGSCEGSERDIHRFSLLGVVLDTVKLDNVMSCTPGSITAPAWDGQYLWITNNSIFTVYKLALSAPPPPMIPLTGVTINGPTTGTINTAYTFTATTSPVTATVPITYVWEATGQTPVVHTVNSISDTASFTWGLSGSGMVPVDGIQVVTVTATNTANTVANTRLIVIGAPPSVTPLDHVMLNGPTSGTVNTAYTFTATVSPLSATTPITYTWSPAPVAGQGTASAGYQWTTPSIYAITLTAENAGSTVSDTHTITISAPPGCSRLLSQVSINGPVSGYTDTLYAFTAAIIPSDATTPITYTWSPAPTSGQGTANVNYQWATPGIYTLTLTAENCGGGVSDTHTVAINAAPTSAGDAYEPDNTCIQARSIITDGSVQAHTFHVAGDNDWVYFQGISGTTFLIEARTPSDSLADVALEVYNACDALPSGNQDYNFSPDVRLQFKAPADGAYYLHLTNHDPTIAGPDVSYQLSVRSLSSTATPGALVLVAGRLKANDPLQRNIHDVTNAVCRLFRANGYPQERIYYLAANLDLRCSEGDPSSDVNALVSKENLRRAITQWAVDKVGPNRAFTLYLMDHGGNDLLYLNGRTETVAPDELDDWLDQLEQAAPGVRVNVIVEACHSGSFIDGLKSLSKPGRVVMASTASGAVAYATQEGAVFSDAFVSALNLGMSLYGSFEDARWTAYEAHPDQVPWLDDDGNGRPNEAEDGLESSRRGFAYAGTFPEEKWPPYIVWAQVGGIKAGNGVITAEVQDDVGVLSVWAVVYKPSYQPPPPGEEMVQETLGGVPLSDPNGDHIFTGLYEGFDEMGQYRIVIYAIDKESLQSRPKAVKVRTGWQVYLPMVVKGQ